MPISIQEIRRNTIYLTVVTILLIFVVFSFTNISSIAQDDSTELTCTDDALQAAIEAGTNDILERNPDAATEFNPEYAYVVGEITLQFALDCGYQPSFPQVEAQIDRTLSIAPLSLIIAASSIGNDVDVALEELETVNGDSFTGQLLYNGLEMGLDGAELGCAGCHNGEAAPLTEGVYTRIEEIRLMLSEFADYSIERYMVEAILHPEAFIVPEYEDVIMPANYGGRLDAQQLADIVAYLESQDQALDSTENTEDTDTEDITILTTSGVDIKGLCDSEGENICSSGDAIRGEALYYGSALPETGPILGCAGCHDGGVLGPDTLGTWERVINERLTLPQYEGFTGEEFLAEAIIAPNAYIPDGFATNVMPLTYDDQLSLQDLADIIAFLRDN